MRILHLSDRLSARGGADWHLLGVLASLAERGHEQILAVGRDDGSARPECNVRRVTGLDALRGAPVAACLDELASSFSPERIHIHNAIGPEALDWAAKRGAIATVQDHRSFCPARGKLTLTDEPCRQPMSKSLCQSCFGDADYFKAIMQLTEARLAALGEMRAITVLSHYMKAELVTAGLAADQIEVIAPFVHGLETVPNIETEPRAAADRDAPCVLFAGRLVQTKGVLDAIEAHQLADTGLPLLIAGTGPQRSELERRAQLPNAAHEVLGWVPHDALPGLLGRARALIMPSRWQEPFGIIGLEALHEGVPVAAWDSGGVREWHDDPQLLVEWGDVEALAVALREAVAGRQVRFPGGFEREPLMDRLEQLYAVAGASVV